MRLFTCAHEQEIAEALRRGQWPDGCGVELRNHVIACQSCSDLVLVRTTFQGARAEAGALPRLEAPGTLWWRAQLRRRNAAIERIDKPLLGAQLFAFAVAFAVGAGTLMWQFRQGHRQTAWVLTDWGLTDWVRDLRGALHFDSLLSASFAVSDGGLWVLAPVLAMIALLSGVVVYLASERQ
jgi:hypothetical protein